MGEQDKQTEKAVPAPRRRLALLTEAGFFVAVAVVILVTSRERLFFDPGTFWHTVTGERILTTGFFTTDPYSYTMAGREWVPTQWLAEVGMAALHRLRTLDGVLWGTVVTVAGLLAWLGGRFVRFGCHPLLAALLVALIFGASCYHYHARPHLLSMVLLGGTFALLVDVEAGRSSFRNLWWLAPAFVLWTNVHGGMLAGLGTLGIVGVGWGLVWLTAGRGPLRSWRDVALLAVIGVVCGLAVLASPYGVTLPRMWWQIMRADLPAAVAEHAPLNPLSPIGYAVIGLGLFYLFMLLGVSPRQWRVTWLLPVVWFVLAWTRVRHGPLFAVTAAVALADLLAHTHWMQAFARRSDLFVVQAEDGPRPAASALAAPLLRVVLYGFIPVAWLLTPWSAGWVQLDPKVWPLELTEDLRALAKQPNVRLFNDDPFGGFLIYFVPELPVFFDDRCELYGDDLLPAYIDALSHAGLDPPDGGRFFALLDRFGVTHVLTKTLLRDEGGRPKGPAPFANLLLHNDRWELVRQTDAGSLFRRKAAGSR
jgi:hypothetical protein